MISLNRTHKGWIQTAAGLLSLLLLLIPNMNPAAEEVQGTKVSKKALEREAALNLWRLKKSVKEDGFYNAHIILNVWRSNALDAGIFKQAEYDEYKKQIYEKSIINSLQCFEAAVENENHTDAKICLRTWKMRTEELDRFDQNLYDEMKAEVDALKK